MNQGLVLINDTKLEDPRARLSLEHLSPQPDGKTYLGLVSVGKRQKLIVIATTEAQVVRESQPQQ